MSDIRENIDPYTQSAFSVENRVKRLIWDFTWAILFRPSPRPFHGWRSFLLRCFGAKLGKGCHVYPRARIWAPWNLVMDDGASLGDDVSCYSMGTITLGKKVTVSQGAHLCAGSHDYASESFQLFTKPITIGDRAWVCADVFIHPGVTIGEGAVIGARSVVTKDMPEWMVCTGHPCEPIKKREMKSEKEQ